MIKTLLSEKNPQTIRRRAKMREALTNMTPTFLCPNCIGGILFHDLGLQFRSPVVQRGGWIRLRNIRFLQMKHGVKSDVSI